MSLTPVQDVFDGPSDPPMDASLPILEQAFAGIRDGGRCPIEQCLELEKAIRDRTRELGGYIRQLVRVVRLAALCSRNSYLEFFCRGLGGSNRFQQLVASAALPADAIQLSAEKVTFLEEQLRASDGKPFELAFRQMPRLAALLEVLHYTLGHETLFNGRAARDPSASDADKGLLWPMVSPTPSEPADECARRLQSEFGRWLSTALNASAYESRQFELMASYLQRRDMLQPERIDNELLLEFWRDQAFDEERKDSLGFKLYASAVRALLRFRRALIIERSERHDVGIGTQPDELNLERVKLEPIETTEWTSPLYGLTSFPCNAVKWLNASELRRLRHYLPGGGPSDAVGRDDEESGALMGPDRFDVQFVPTLLRVDVFGAAQGRIVASVRRKGDPAGIDAVNDDAYVQARQGYAAIQAFVVEAAHAALYCLGTRGEASALVLLEHLSQGGLAEYSKYFPDLVGHDLTEPELESLRVKLIEHLRSAFKGHGPLATATVVPRARAAASKIKRDGFRGEQQSLPNVVAAYVDAAPKLVALLRELVRLDVALTRLPLADMTVGDRDFFAAVFEHLYSQGE